MRNITWTRALSVFGAAFLIASCSAAPDADEEASASSEESIKAGEVELVGNEEEVTVVCTDSEAQAANEGHDPAGWPQDWNEGEPLPDPECHPDFIEVLSWDRYDEFSACWEGPETSTLVRTADMTEQDVYHSVWEQSQARADWEVPASDEGEPPEGASEECREILDEYHAG